MPREYTIEEMDNQRIAISSSNLPKGWTHTPGGTFSEDDQARKDPVVPGHFRSLEGKPRERHVYSLSTGHISEKKKLPVFLS